MPVTTADLNINRAYAKSKRANQSIRAIATRPEVPGGISNSQLATDALAELESACADLREFLRETSQPQPLSTVPGDF